MRDLKYLNDYRNKQRVPVSRLRKDKIETSNNEYY